MKAKLTPFHIALMAGALIVGVLIDRLVSVAVVPATSQQGRFAAVVDERATNDSQTGRETKRSDAVANAPIVQPANSGASTNKGSLDAILTEANARQRLADLSAFISRLGPAEYPDAFKRTRQITSSNERELASRLLLTQWAQADPDGALQFAAGNRGFEYVAEDVFQELAGKNFNDALARAQAIPGQELRYRALRGTLANKADTDPRAALELAKTLGEFRGNEPLTSVIFRQWAATDPQAAAAAASASVESGEGGWRSPVNSVVQTWATQDPVAAANWSLAISNPEAQSRSIAQVMREWTRQDPNAAANFINKLESGAAHDAAVAGLAQALVATDPSTALSWTGTIIDDQTRQQTLQRLSPVVMWRDPENGPAMLQSAGLPADQIRGGRGRGRDGGGRR